MPKIYDRRNRPFCLSMKIGLTGFSNILHIHDLCHWQKLATKKIGGHHAFS